MTDPSTAFRFDDKMNFDFHAPRRVRAELSSALRAAETLEFIRQLDEMPTAFRFKHTLLQEAAYSTLTRHERKRLHGITANVLETAHRDDLDPLSAELAQHYAAAGDDVKTVEFAARAAETNRRSFAYPEARVHYVQALDALARLPESVEHRRRKVDLWLRYLDLRWSGGTAVQDLAFLEELEQSTRTLLTEQASDPDDRLRLARIHSTRAGMYFAANQVPLAMQTFREVLAEAQDLGDDELLAEPSLMIGAALVVQGFFAQALPLVTRAWSVWQDHPARWEWVSIVHTTTALANLGKIQEAHALIQSIVEHQDLPESSRALTFLNMSRANLAWAERAPAIMLESSQRAVQSSRIDGDPLDLYIGLAYQALAESMLGQPDAARAHMDESQRVSARMGGQLIYSDWVAAFYAETQLQLGDPAGALVLAEKAWELARTIDGLFAQGLAQRTWAHALLAQTPSNRAAAIEHLQASLAALEQVEAPVETERTRTALKTLLDKP